MSREDFRKALEDHFHVTRQTALRWLQEIKIDRRSTPRPLLAVLLPVGPEPPLQFLQVGHSLDLPHPEAVRGLADQPLADDPLRDGVPAPADVPDELRGQGTLVDDLGDRQSAEGVESSSRFSSSSGVYKAASDSSQPTRPRSISLSMNGNR